jgi:hypothetical protein
MLRDGFDDATWRRLQDTVGEDSLRRELRGGAVGRFCECSSDELWATACGTQADGL